MLIIPGKIPVRLNPLFLLLIVFIGWINSQTILGTVVWMVVVFFSVLAHEFGHALTAVVFGQSAQIELFALGGVTQRSGPPLKLWQDFVIVLNGPLAGLLLFFVAFLFRLYFQGQPMNIVLYAIEITFFVNLFWTLVNLLPIQPLDGGHLLRIFLEGILGFRGIKLAYLISFLLSALVSLSFIALGSFLIGALFFMFAFESFRYWKNILPVREQDQNMALQNLFKKAESEIRSGKMEEAYKLLRSLREQAEAGVLFMAATEHMARIADQFGRAKEVYELLNPYARDLSPDGVQLLHQSAYHLGNWEEAIALGNRLFQYQPDYDTALINALCYAMLCQAQPAVGWLQTAINEGLPNLTEALRMREFDSIKDTQTFQSFLEAVKNDK
jgi:Zn-dependent protease